MGCNYLSLFLIPASGTTTLIYQTLNSQTTSILKIDKILNSKRHYSDVIMGAIASQITSLTIVYSTVYSDGDQRKHQSSASLAFVWGIHCWPVNSPHKWPVTQKMFPFDDVIVDTQNDIPYPAIAGEIWCVFVSNCELLRENWPC